MIQLLSGDTIEKMKTIPDDSVNLICCDLPYEKTKNKWDIIIDPVLLWREYKRILKDSGVIVLFGQGSFTAKMILSNEDMYRYSLVYEKTTSTGHLNANRQPMRSHEDIMVFTKNAKHTYNPQKTTGHQRKVSSTSHKRNSKETTNYNKHGKTSYDSTERFPRSVWKFKTDKQKNPLHPTQKPVALIEEIVKTYSNEGDVILDNCAGSGTTGEACQNTNRNCILIENDPVYIKTIEERLQLLFIYVTKTPYCVSDKGFS